MYFYGEKESKSESEKERERKIEKRDIRFQIQNKKRLNFNGLL